MLYKRLIGIIWTAKLRKNSWLCGKTSLLYSPTCSLKISILGINCHKISTCVHIQTWICEIPTVNMNCLWWWQCRPQTTVSQWGETILSLCFSELHLKAVSASDFKVYSATSIVCAVICQLILWRFRWKNALHVSLAFGQFWNAWIWYLSWKAVTPVYDVQDFCVCLKMECFYIFTYWSIQ